MKEKKSSQKNIKKSSLGKLTVNHVKMQSEIWPIERDVFFRPARLKYVRRLLEKQDCVFCETAKNKISKKTLCLYKSKFSQIVVNKFPYNSGHLLVIPLGHCGDLLDLSSEAYQDLYLTLQLAVKAIVEVYKPQGYNIGLNNGATAGAGIPEHIHFHIVPRWNGDLNFFPLIAETKLVIETAEETYVRLASFFKDKGRRL